MSVSYEKLRVILARYRITHETLRKGTGCTTSEIAKINKDEYMTMISIERITKYLTRLLKRRVRVDDILSFKDDDL